MTGRGEALPGNCGQAMDSGPRAPSTMWSLGSERRNAFGPFGRPDAYQGTGGPLPWLLSSCRSPIQFPRASRVPGVTGFSPEPAGAAAAATLTGKSAEVCLFLAPGGLPVAGISEPSSHLTLPT